MIQPAYSPLISQIIEKTRLSAGLNISDESSIVSVARSIALELGLKLTIYEEQLIVDYFVRSRSIFGVLQELADDYSISDIIVSNYQQISFQRDRLNYHSKISFPSRESYESYVEQLIIMAGGACSNKQPIFDGIISSEARISVVHQSIAADGPYLTLRFNRFRVVSIKNLQEQGLAPMPILYYLKSILINGASILIVGEVGTGKTTLLRALANEIPCNQALLVIEDTPEIKLSHCFVRYVRTRQDNIEDVGKITAAQCIKAGMRMAMNRIIFGEIRDSEAAESFIDVCSSGHPGLSTIHGKSIADAIIRLELFLTRAQRGINSTSVQKQISTALQVVVHVGVCSKTRKRRILEVREIGVCADGCIRQATIFKYLMQSNFNWVMERKIGSLNTEFYSSSEAINLQDFPDCINLSTEFLC